MKLIEPSFEILNNSGSIEKDVEIAARTCYKSENKITDGSAKILFDKLVESKHFAMLEHATVYLQMRAGLYTNIYFTNNPYTVIKRDENENDLYITTNYRVLLENNRLHLLAHSCEPTEHHEKRISVKFVLDRGISHEFVRHRVFSFAQESTRYCNYSNDKFDNELTFIKPYWITHEQLGLVKKMNEGNSLFILEATKSWYHSILSSEQAYLELLKSGWTPQLARSVLPNSLKTELIMTGTISQWKGFFDLRCANSAHPQARELAIPLQERFKELGLL